MEYKPQGEIVGHLANAAQGCGRFKSCWWIQEGLFLHYSGEIRPCCLTIPGPDRHRTVLYGFYDDENFDLMAARRRLQIANQGPEAPCAGCCDLVEGDWRHVNYRSMVNIFTATFCNYNCSYCGCHSNSPQPPINAGAVMNWLEKWLDGGLLHPQYTRLSVADGEPLLNAFFGPGSEFCLRHGFQMELFSNSSVPSDRVVELAEAGLLRLITSLDAGTAETYARIRGADGLERVWTNIARYLEAAPEASKENIHLKYILLEPNLSRREIDAFAERVERHGLRTVLLNIENHALNMSKIGNVGIAKYVDAGGYFLHRLRRIPGVRATPDLYAWPRLNEVLEKRAAEFDQSPNLIAGRVPAEAPRSPLPIVHSGFDQKLSLKTIRREMVRKDDFCVYSFGLWRPEEQPAYFFELAGYFVQDALSEHVARHPRHGRLYRMAARARQIPATLPLEFFSELPVRPDDYLVDFITDDDGSRLFRIDFKYRRSA